MHSGLPKKYDPNDFDRAVALASITTLYMFGAEERMHELQEGAADAFCKLFDVFTASDLESMGISLTYGEEDDH
jgi:hypothetical protein